MCDCDKYVKFTIARIAMLQLVFKAEVSEMRLSKSLSLLKKKDQKYDGWDSSKIYKVWDKNRPVQTFVP